MIRKAILAAWLAIVCSLSLTAEEIEIEIRNPVDWARPAAPVVIERKSLNIPAGQTVVAVADTKGGHDWPRPFQLDDLDEDGEWDELFFQVNIGPEDRVSIRVGIGPKPDKPPQFPKRVDAIIDAQPGPRTVIKPAWESELAGYCTYGCTQMDVLGKIQPRLVLDYYYGKEPHSQHHFTPEYGQDYLLTANTMGAHAIFVREADGRIARPWTTNAYAIGGKLERDAKYDSKVLASGPLRALVRTRISNWVTDAGEYECAILYSIAALQRHTGVSLRFSKMPGDGKALQIGAGMRRMYEDVHFRKYPEYMTALARDVLEGGIVDRYVARAILAPRRYTMQAIDIPDDPGLKLMPRNGPNYGLLFPKGMREVRYAFVTAWEKDGGVTSLDQWEEFLARLSDELEFPPEVRIRR